MDTGQIVLVVILTIIGCLICKSIYNSIDAEIEAFKRKILREADDSSYERCRLVSERSDGYKTSADKAEMRIYEKINFLYNRMDSLVVNYNLMDDRVKTLEFLCKSVGERKEEMAKNDD